MAPMVSSWDLQRATRVRGLPEGCSLTSKESGANAAFLQKAVKLPRREVSRLSPGPLPAIRASLWVYGGRSRGCGVGRLPRFP